MESVHLDSLKEKKQQTEEMVTKEPETKQQERLCHWG